MKIIKNNLILFVLILLSSTPIIWFLGKGSVLINGVDTNFPLNPEIWFARRFFAWINITNSGADFSAGSAGTFFHFLQYLPYKLGFSLQIIEIFTFIFWFALIIFSSWFFARLILPKRKIAQLIFVVLYSFNIYLFNTWENVKVANLSLISAIPLGLSFILLRKEARLTQGGLAFLSSMLGLILMGAGINPGYIICFFIILFIFVITQLDKQRLTDFLIITVFVTLVNSFWILPTINFIFGSITSSNSITSIGFTNWVDSLSQNTSLINVIRMQGAWDWYSFDTTTNLPLYIPYATRYFFNPIFIAFSFFVPVIAFLSFIIHRKKLKFLYVSFGVMLILGIFLTSGTHPPTGEVFAFLGRHVPFFSLFRSPWYIFAPLVGLSIAGLCSLFFDKLNNYWNHKIVMICGILFILCFLVYSYPLLLGKIFRPNFNGSFYINFPEYVFRAGEFLNNTTARGRILSYPDDNIEKFTWGYSGVDSILTLMSDRQVVGVSLNESSSNFSKIVTQIYEAFKRNEIEKATYLINILGIGQIFDKSDQVTLAPPLPDVVKKNHIGKFDKWNFYNFPENSVMPKIFSSNCCSLGWPQEDSSLNLPFTQGKVLINPNDSLLQNAKLDPFKQSIIHAKNLQLDEYMLNIAGQGNERGNLSFRDLGNVNYEFNVPYDTIYEPILQQYAIDSFNVINNNQMKVNLDGRNITLNITKRDDSYIYFQPIEIKSGEHKLSVEIQNVNLINEAKFIKSGDGTFDINNETFSLFNTSKKDISLLFPVSDFDPFSYYLINVSYRQIYGSKAQILLDQRSRTTLFKNQAQVMPYYPDWQDYSFYYQPVESDSVFNIGLLAPFTEDVLGTRIQYRNLSVYKIFANELFFRDNVLNDFPTVNVEFEQNSPVSYKGVVRSVLGPHIIIFNETYSPDWKINISSKAKAFHFTANSFANGWFIDGDDDEYEFNIYYQPQEYLKIGYLIAGGSIIFALLYYLLDRRKIK